MQCVEHGSKVLGIVLYSVGDSVKSRTAAIVYGVLSKNLAVSRAVARWTPMMITGTTAVIDMACS